MQGVLANIWKENLLEDLESEEVEYGLAGEFYRTGRKNYGEIYMGVSESS